jgi:hypothetical protein
VSQCIQCNCKSVFRRQLSTRNKRSPDGVCFVGSWRIQTLGWLEDQQDYLGKSTYNGRSTRHARKNPYQSELCPFVSGSAWWAETFEFEINYNDHWMGKYLQHPSRNPCRPREAGEMVCGTATPAVRSSEKWVRRRNSPRCL